MGNVNLWALHSFIVSGFIVIKMTKHLITYETLRHLSGKLQAGCLHHCSIVLSTRPLDSTATCEPRRLPEQETREVELDHKGLLLICDSVCQFFSGSFFFLRGRWGGVGVRVLLLTAGRKYTVRTKISQTGQLLLSIANDLGVVLSNFGFINSLSTTFALVGHNASFAKCTSEV